jgi:hypothetical protein
MQCYRHLAPKGAFYVSQLTPLFVGNATIRLCPTRKLATSFLSASSDSGSLPQ